LRDKASNRADRFLAGTKVAVPADEGRRTEILGFFTLVFHEYRDHEMPKKVARTLGVSGLHRVPMILLAQMGVRSDLARRGIGKLLMRNALELSLVLAKEAGSVAVITDPIDEEARDYYQTKFDFRDIGERIAATGQPRLFLPMKTIERAYVEANANLPMR
jgi:GNAT superfamily N-acetyltransferase